MNTKSKKRQATTFLDFFPMPKESLVIETTKSSNQPFTLLIQNTI
jgi:hypothetical protein